MRSYCAGSRRDADAIPDSRSATRPKEAIKRLDVALELQYRSALQGSIAAASLAGTQALALGPQLAEFGDRELSGARAAIEKLVSSGGKPTTEVAKLKHQTKRRKRCLADRV